MHLAAVLPLGFDVKALIPQGLTRSPNYLRILNDLMTLIICESLREIDEVACVTSAWSSRGQKVFLKNNVKSRVLFDNRYFLKILHLAAIKLCRILILSTGWLALRETVSFVSPRPFVIPPNSKIEKTAKIWFVRAAVAPSCPAETHGNTITVFLHS